MSSRRDSCQPGYKAPLLRFSRSSSVPTCWSGTQAVLSVCCSASRNVAELWKPPAQCSPRRSLRKLILSQPVTWEGAPPPLWANPRKRVKLPTHPLFIQPYLTEIRGVLTLFTLFYPYKCQTRLFLLLLLDHYCGPSAVRAQWLF